MTHVSLRRGWERQRELWWVNATWRYLNHRTQGRKLRGCGGRWERGLCGHRLILLLYHLLSLCELSMLLLLLMLMHRVVLASRLFIIGGVYWVADLCLLLLSLLHVSWSLRAFTRQSRHHLVNEATKVAVVLIGSQTLKDFLSFSFGSRLNLGDHIPCLVAFSL